MRISDWSSDVCSSDLLATAFMTGLEACLKLGADVIVNTDADNQYEGQDVPKLTSPILAGQADMVIGARPISETEHFSWIKKKLQHLGSWAVRVASKTDVADAPSGFRAISREAAMRLNVFNPYTYTLERSEEQTSELQSLMRISYAVFCLKKKK